MGGEYFRFRADFRWCNRCMGEIDARNLTIAPTNPTNNPSLRGPTSAEQAAVPDAIKQARFNLYLVQHDASFGVHRRRNCCTSPVCAGRPQTMLCSGSVPPPAP